MKQSDIASLYSLHKKYKLKVLNYIKSKQKSYGIQGVGSKDILLQKINDHNQECYDNNGYSTKLLNEIILPTWDYRISFQILMKLTQINSKIVSIFATLLMIADGYFQTKQEKGSMSIFKTTYQSKFEAFFVQIHKKFTILFEVGLHKENYSEIEKNQEITCELRHKITFIDLLSYYKQNDVQEIIINYKLSSQQDSQRNISEKKICSLQQIVQNKQGFKHIFDSSNSDWPEIQFDNNNNQVQWLPLTFENLRYHNDELIYNEQSRQYDEKLFRYRNQTRYEIQEISYSNQNILKQYSDMQMAGRIIEYICNSSEFKVQLSPEQFNLISTKQNSIVIGRSGTGKTTSQVLKLFASEYLMKIRSKLQNLDHKKLLKDYNFEKIPLRNVYITENQKLVQKVQEYYDKLELIVRKISKQGKKEEYMSLDDSFISYAQSDITCIELEAIDSLLNDEDMQKVQHQQSTIFNQTKELFPTLKQDFQFQRFPSFISTLNLIILIDKQITSPYFSQEKIEKLLEKYFVEVGVQYYQGLEINNVYIPQSNQNQRKQNIRVPLIDFQLFFDKFWEKKIIQKHNQQSNQQGLASLVWTQIQSIIKGSQYSYKYPEFALPFSIYKEKVENQIEEHMIKVIYEYYLQYEDWKISHMFIDQLDIINNILYNLEKYPIKLFSLHYLYIDEVQDLTQAAINLFLKLAEQKIMLSGDSAQSIQKGVAFKFEDLQQQLQITKREGINQVDQYKEYLLTINYRTHNNILQLANSIIKILELLFPFSIDILQKEFSNLKGPKPLFFEGSQENSMFSYLGQQYLGDQNYEVEFGFGQVVIVRDQDAKDILPNRYEQAQVLTIQQAKGLEFDDVILYNLFQTNQINQSQWDVLSCLDVEDQIIDKMLFDYKMTKHQIEDSQFSENNEQVVKLKQIKLNEKYNKKQIKNYSNICDELKLLYVAITRAKKRLLIFDENPIKRRQLEKILIQLQLCDYFEKNSTQNTDQYYPKEIKKYQYTEDEITQWEQRGKEYFDKQIYDEALKCYKRTNNYKMISLSQAYLYLQNGQRRKVQYKNLIQSQQKEQQKKILEAEFLFKDYYKKAACKFEELNDDIQAAHSYYSGKFYQECIIIFLNNGLYSQAAKASQKAGFHLLSALILFKIEDYYKCLEVLRESGVDPYFHFQILSYAYNQQKLSKAQVSQEISKIEQSPHYIFFQLQKQVKTQFNQNQGKKQQSLSKICNDVIIKKTQFEKLFKQEISIYEQSQNIQEVELIKRLEKMICTFSTIFIESIKKQSCTERINLENFHQISNQEQQCESSSQNEIDYLVIPYLETISCIDCLIVFPQQNQYLYRLFCNDEQKIQFNVNNTQSQDELYLNLQYSIFKRKFKFFCEQFNILKNTQFHNSILEIIQLRNDSLNFQYQNIIEKILNFQQLFSWFEKFQQQMKQNNINSIFKFTVLALQEDAYFLENIIMIKNTKINITNYIQKVNSDNAQQLKEFQKIYLYNFIKNNKNKNEEFYKFAEMLFNLPFNIQYEQLENKDLNYIFDFQLKSIGNNEQDFEQFCLLLYILEICTKDIKLDMILQQLKLEQRLKLMYFIQAGTMLLENNIDNKLRLRIFFAACAVYNVYIFQSKELNFIGPTFAIIDINKNSLIKLDQSNKIKFNDKYYLVDSMLIIQSIQKKFRNFIQIIKPLQICNKLILDSKQIYKPKQCSQLEELIFIHQFKKIIINYFQKENEISNIFQTVQQFTYLCDYLQVKIPDDFPQIDKCVISRYLRFYKIKEGKIDIFAVIQWFKFIQHKKIRKCIFDYYAPQQLEHEVNYIVLCFLILILNSQDKLLVVVDEQIVSQKFKEIRNNNLFVQSIVDQESQSEIKHQFWDVYEQNVYSLINHYHECKSQTQLSYNESNFLILNSNMYKYLDCNIIYKDKINETCIDIQNSKLDKNLLLQLFICVIKMLINIILQIKTDSTHSSEYYKSLLQIIVYNIKIYQDKQKNCKNTSTISKKDIDEYIKILREDQILNLKKMEEVKQILQLFLIMDEIKVENFQKNEKIFINQVCQFKEVQGEVKYETYYDLRMLLSDQEEQQKNNRIKFTEVYQDIFQFKKFLIELAFYEKLKIFQFQEVNHVIKNVVNIEKQLDNSSHDIHVQHNKIRALIKKLEEWLDNQPQQQELQRIWQKHMKFEQKK